MIEKARAEGAALERAGAFFPAEQGDESPRTFPSLSPGPDSGAWDLDVRLTWAHHVENAPEWLAPFLEVPAPVPASRVRARLLPSRRRALLKLFRIVSCLSERCAWMAR